MSLRTCSWLLPQKLQRYGILGPLLVVVTRLDPSFAPAPCYPLLRGRCGTFSVARVFRCLPRACRVAGAILARQRRCRGRVDSVDYAVVLGLRWGHEVVPGGIGNDPLDRLPRVAAENLVICVDQSLHLLDLDEDVRRVAPETTRTLVDHDPGVPQGEPLPGSPGGEQNRRHAGRHADADRADGCPHVLHRVVDGQTAGDDPAGRVDVQADVAFRILGVEEEKLGDEEG